MKYSKEWEHRFHIKVRASVETPLSIRFISCIYGTFIIFSHVFVEIETTYSNDVTIREKQLKKIKYLFALTSNFKEEL